MSNNFKFIDKDKSSIRLYSSTFKLFITMHTSKILFVAFMSFMMKLDFCKYFYEGFYTYFFF